MRELKFRGMCLQGNWYIGLLCKYEGITYISNSIGVPRAYMIRPETVGQYTGLKDKNGVKIFEGDIVDFGGSKQKIVFDRGCFYMEDSKEADMVPWILDIKYHDMSEVLGNIYENPHLLINKK